MLSYIELREIIKEIYKRIKYIKKFLNVSDRDILIDHFVELRRHFKIINQLLDDMQLLFFESFKIEEIQVANEKERIKIEKLFYVVKKEFWNIKILIKKAIGYNEDILKIRVINQVRKQKNELIKIIRSIDSNMNRIRKILDKLLDYMKEYMTTVEPISKIDMLHKALSNGWKLSNIQNVVIELGGFIKENPGGQHPYKIVFVGNRPIPLATSTPPELLLNEIYNITRRIKKYIRIDGRIIRISDITKRGIRNSFYAGRLLVVS